MKSSTDIEAVAWLEEPQVYALGTSAYPWGGPLFTLIRGVYQAFPFEARRILRQRIFTNTTPLTDFDRSVVRVAAKRTAIKEAPPTQSLGQLLQAKPPPFWSAPLPSLSPPDLVAWISEQEPDPARPRHQRARAVGAAIYDSSGSLLVVARNSNASDRTQHAELNLLQTLASKGVARIPPGATLWVSLEPCRMCASALVACAEDIRSNKFYFLKRDPGPLARETRLSGIAQLHAPRLED